MLARCGLPQASDESAREVLTLRGRRTLDLCSRPSEAGALARLCA